MKLQQWCQKAERINVHLARQYFNMDVGLHYDQRKIAVLEKQSLLNSEFFLKHFKEPRILWLESIGSVVDAKTYKLSIKLKDVREKKISAKINGKTVNWNTWRQFVVRAKDSERKMVFDNFIKKVPIITPLIKERFDESLKIYKKYREEPLSAFCYETSITLKKLKSVINELKSLFRKSFLREFSSCTNKFLGREPAYYDDLYFMRNIVHENLEGKFAHLDPLKEIHSLFKSMNLDYSRIKVDKAERKKKFPSPFCSFIQIPSDIRVSYKKENPLNTLIGVFHEFGHAIHASNINQNLEYWKKYEMSDALTETFSTFFENLISNPLFLTGFLKIPEETANEIKKRISFIDKLAVMFYCANSSFKIAFWEKNLSFREADEYYAKQIKECMGLDVPGRYWQLHHILPEDLVYVPGYLLAMIKAEEIERNMVKRYGYEWWSNRKSSEYITRIIEKGTDSEVNNFNDVNPRLLLRKLE